MMGLDYRRLNKIIGERKYFTKLTEPDIRLRRFVVWGAAVCIALLVALKFVVGVVGAVVVFIDRGV